MKVVDDIPNDLFLLQLEHDDIYNIGQDIINKLQVNGNSCEKKRQGSEEKPTSPRAKCGRPANPTPRHRRQSHIKAEYKRRDKIQKGFETLKELVPSLGEISPKESKSAKLFKTVEYCRQLKADSKNRQDEASALRAELEALGSQIHTLQKDLPATGISVVDKPCQMDRMYDEYLQSRTKQNWKFWIFSFIMKPLYDSYRRVVTTRTPAEFIRTVIDWAKDQLSLINLRPGVFTSLRQISTQTKIMDKPEELPQQALETIASSSKLLPREPVVTSKPEAVISSSSSSMDYDSFLGMLGRNDNVTMATTNGSSQNLVSSTSLNDDDLIGDIDYLITDSLLNSFSVPGDIEEPMSTSSFPTFSEALFTTAESNTKIRPLPVTAISIDTPCLAQTVQSDLSLDSIFCTQTSPVMVQSGSSTDPVLSYVINTLATTNPTNTRSSSIPNLFKDL